MHPLNRTNLFINNISELVEAINQRVMAHLVSLLVKLVSLLVKLVGLEVSLLETLANGNRSLSKQMQTETWTQQ